MRTTFLAFSLTWLWAWLFPAKPAKEPAAEPVMTDRERVIATAAREVGTREATGRNDGPVVKYLEAVGLRKGDPYCAAFVYWVGREALGERNPYPRSGWSPDFVKAPTWTQGKGTTPAPGDTFGIWFGSKGRIAHTGYVEQLSTNGKSIHTIEANTSPDASSGSAADRDGEGVYRKIRPLSTIRHIKRWLP